jgi:hypothetical protein
LLHDRAAHRRSPFHEFPHPCGGCHFYSGAFGVLVDLLPETERAEWWERWDGGKLEPLSDDPTGPPFCAHGEPTRCADCAKARADDLARTTQRAATT